MLPYDPALRLRLGDQQVASRFGTLLVLVVACAGAVAAERGGGRQAWAGGFVVAVLVLAALVLHLAFRLWVGRRLGLRTRRAHLAVFGAVPDALDDAQTPRAEALIGFAGLLAIVGLAALASTGAVLGGNAPAVVADPARGAAVALAGLAVVQAMPGLPLDGGRLLRGLVWYLTDSPLAGARAAAVYAQLIAAGMIVFGIVAFAFAGPMPYWGLWAVIGGWQLGGEARASLFRLRWQRLAQLTELGELVVPPLSLPGATTIDDALGALIDAGADAPLLVLDASGRPTGVLRLANLRGCPRDEWVRRPVADVATPLADLPRLEAAKPAREALAVLDDLEGGQTSARGRGLVVIVRNGIPVAALDRRRILLRLLSLDRGDEEE